MTLFLRSNWSRYNHEHGLHYIAFGPAEFIDPDPLAMLTSRMEHGANVGSVNITVGQWRVADWTQLFCRSMFFHGFGILALTFAADFSLSNG